MKTLLPEEFRKYFWDTSIANVDPVKHKKYVIAKILEYGDQKSLRWLFKNYSKSDIAEAAKNSRELTKKTAKAWEKLLYAY